MLEDDDYVYFFLREQAVEYINCGKVRRAINQKIYIWDNADTKKGLGGGTIQSSKCVALPTFTY